MYRNSKGPLASLQQTVNISSSRVLRQLLIIAVVIISWDQIVYGQTLNWSSPREYTPIQIGGQANGLGGVGVANWNNSMYIAYTDNSGNGDVWLTHTSDGVNFATPVQVTVTGSQTVYSAANPSLAVFNNKLYIAWVDNFGDATFVSTSDGSTFGSTLGLCTNGTAMNSPSLAAFDGYLYLGYRTTSSTYGNCRIATDNSTQNSTYGYSVGESPALGVFNNRLYVAYKDTGGDHYIYLLISSDGSTFSQSSAATGSHTSTACSIAVHHNVLYIGFRQNDSGDRFYYTYSTDGVNFSGPIEVHWTMGGPPALVSSPSDLYLFNVFRQNDTGHYLFTAYGQ
ncbi:MAG: hypothetical protein QJR10_14540 [Bacillota bacterium]|jgi:hypothetical protein|nr:hypothetical protein [Bacillota bacterium]